jgi:hypothetical protein
MTIKPVDPRLEKLLQSLDEVIALARDCDSGSTARLIAMARLDLQMQIHNITDRELQALADALEQEDASPGAFQPSASAFDRWDTVKALEMLGRSGGRSAQVSAPKRDRRYRKNRQHD